jgi:hypothetical protein
MPPDAKTTAYSSPGDRVRAAVKCDGDSVIYLLGLVATGTGFPEESTPSGGWADGGNSLNLPSGLSRRLFGHFPVNAAYRTKSAIPRKLATRPDGCNQLNPKTLEPS